MASKLVVLVLVALLVKTGECIVCTPDFCASVQCEAVTDCTAPNQVIKPGGFCNCCNTCHTILGENESCSSLSSIIRGGPPPNVECGKGLICENGKCTAFKNVGRV